MGVNPLCGDLVSFCSCICKICSSGNYLTFRREVLDVVVVMESKAIAKREKEAVTLTMNVRAPLYVALATVHG